MNIHVTMDSWNFIEGWELTGRRVRDEVQIRQVGQPNLIWASVRDLAVLIFAGED